MLRFLVEMPMAVLGRSRLQGAGRVPRRDVLVQKVSSTMDQVFYQVMEKSILVVVTGILRIHVGEIAVKVVRFYLLLSLHFLLQIGFKVVRFYLLLNLRFLLQIGFILLHVDLILSKAM
jgi:hypothetical protein